MLQKQVTKFHANCQALRRHGFNLKIKPGIVYVNGEAVDREIVEKAPATALIAKLDEWFGPRRERGIVS